MLDGLTQGQIARKLVVHGLGGAIILCCLAACSKSGNSTKSSKGESEVTTSSAVSKVDASLDFYTERYASPDERLKRRQERLEAALAGKK